MTIIILYYYNIGIDLFSRTDRRGRRRSVRNADRGDQRFFTAAVLYDGDFFFFYCFRSSRSSRCDPDDRD